MKKEIYSRIYYNALIMFQLCCKIYYGVLSDEDIIKAAYAFWFADKDWVGKWGKIWTYMCSNQAK